MRLFYAVALSVTVALLAAYADDKKEAPKDGVSRADRLKTVKKTFDDELAELVKKLQKAKDNAESNGIRTEAKELCVLSAGKAVALAEENPKDDVAFEAAQFAVEKLGMFRYTGATFEKAMGILTENHLGNAKLKTVVMALAQMGEPGHKYLKIVAEKAADKTAKGTALYFLGTSLAEQADDETDQKKIDELTKQAIEYLEKAVKDAGDVKLGRETIAKAAEGDIEALKTLGVGKPAPDVEGTNLDGKKLKLSGYKGKVVLLDIWATWCGPCRAMIPHEREMVKKLKDKPFVMVSVSADTAKEDLTSFLEKEAMPWTHWWDGKESTVLKKYRVKAFPTLYLIDAKGVVRKKWVGSPGNEVLDKAVEGLVAEAEKTS